MTGAPKCLLCGVIFAPFAGADECAASFNAHPCIPQRTRDELASARRRHPVSIATPDGAA